MSQNQPSYIEIKGFADRERSKEVPGSPFKTKSAPKNLQRMLNNVYGQSGAMNSSGGESHYKQGGPSSISLDFILDSTGLKADTRKETEQLKPCLEQLNEFKKLCYDMNGDIHEPNFLQLNWGDIVFDCRLTEMNYEFKEFNKSGLPLRILINATFKEDLTEKERLKREGKNSPDLTHIRFVKEGETLPGLCQDMYKSTAYYLKVAAYNKINHFRSLPTGQKIVFPPVEELPV